MNASVSVSLSERDAPTQAPVLRTAIATGLWPQLRAHRMSSLFSARPWVETVSGTYGFVPEAISLRELDGTAAALLFAQISDLRGERIISFPFSDFCDPLVTSPDTWERLIAPVLARNVPVLLRCLHNTIPVADARFEMLGRLAWHGTGLDRSEADLWAALTSRGRQAVQRGRRAGLNVREDRSLDGVRCFFAMHCQVRKAKYRMLAQPWSFFERLHAAFAPENALVVLIAESDGQPVAASLFLLWQDTVYYKFNASVDRSSGPNDLLVWEGYRLGQRLGLAHFDFGASDLDQPGLLHFKRKYADTEAEIVRLRWQPTGHDHRRAELAGKLLGEMSRLLTEPDVPDDITRAGGDALYAQFA